MANKNDKEITVFYEFCVEQHLKYIEHHLFSTFVNCYLHKKHVISMPGKFVLSKLSGIVIIAFFYIISYLLGPFYTVGHVEGVGGALTTCH